MRASTLEDIPNFVRWDEDAETRPHLGTTGHAWHRTHILDAGCQHWTWIPSTPAGYVVLAGTEKNAVELRRIVIRPGARGQGAGRALLRWVMTHVASLGGQQLWLDVRPSNVRARRLYEAEGFETDLSTRARDQHGELLLMRREVAMRIEE